MALLSADDAPTPVKKCADCQQEKEIDKFHRTSKGQGGRHSYCKICRSRRARTLRVSDEGVRARAKLAMLRYRERTPLYRVRAYTRARFGLEPDVVSAFVQAHLAQHGPRCASCGCECDVVGGVKRAGFRRLVVDHCHTTNKLRAMLCDFCNTALGKLGDSSTKVRKLLSYIEGHE